LSPGLEIVSEASRRLPPEIKSQHSEIDWVAVAAAGNVYRHEYDGVDEKLIWHTVRHDLSALRAVAASELEHLRTAPRPPVRSINAPVGVLE
jgi:uncharacterized protein with HEPN domain